MVNEGIVLGHKISERGIVMMVSIGGLLKTSLKFLGLSLISYKKMFLLFFMMIVYKHLKYLRKPLFLHLLFSHPIEIYPLKLYVMLVIMLLVLF